MKVRAEPNFPPVPIAGKILSRDDDLPIGCVVRVISRVGACLEVRSLVAVPEHFALSVEGIEPNPTCRMVWREGNKIGVAFNPKLD